MAKERTEFRLGSGPSRRSGPGPKAGDLVPKSGVWVFGDALDNWVPTLRVWNQFTYHISNVDEDGRIPPAPLSAEDPSWLTHNTYRANAQGEGVFDAPDVVVQALGAELGGCPTTVTLTAQVANRGALGVREGLNVAFYDGDPDDPQPPFIGVASSFSGRAYRYTVPQKPSVFFFGVQPGIL